MPESTAPETPHAQDHLARAAARDARPRYSRPRGVSLSGRRAVALDDVAAGRRARQGDRGGPAVARPRIARSASASCATRASSGCSATSASCSAGGATTTVYPSSTAEECAFILADSDTRYVFAEDAEPAREAARARGRDAEAREGDPDRRRARRDADDWVMTLAELEAKGAELLAKDPRAVDDIVKGIEGTHLATLDLHVGHDRQAEGRAPAPRVLGVLRRCDRGDAGCGAPTTCSTCGCR